MEQYEKINLSAEISNTVHKPKFELKQEQIERIKKVSSAVLWTIAAKGVVSMAILAPNALQSLTIFEKKVSGKRLEFQAKKKKLIRSFYYLKSNGYIDYKKSKGRWYVFLTKKGKKTAKFLSVSTIMVPKASNWDGKYWEVAADIPTREFRRGADSLRKTLKQLNFYPLQRTMWFYPFDPREQLDFIVKSFDIGRFVTVMRVDHLDPADEKVLGNYFKEIGLI